MRFMEEATDVRGAAQATADRFKALPRPLLAGFQRESERPKRFRARNLVVHCVLHKLIPGPPLLLYGPDVRHTPPALLDPIVTGTPIVKGNPIIALKAHLPPTGRSDVVENGGVMLCVSWSTSEEATGSDRAAQATADRFKALPRPILT